MLVSLNYFLFLLYVDGPILYVFGFTFLSLLSSITCAEITIVLLYFLLCAEDYRWWWRTFLTSGSTAAAFLCVLLYLLESNLPITYLPYFGCKDHLLGNFFLLPYWLHAALWFNIVIFGSIKVD